MLQINAWLAKNVAHIRDKFEQGKVYDNRLWRRDCEHVLARFPVSGGRDQYAHLRLDEFNDNVAALPAELMQQLNDGQQEFVMEPQPPAVVPATTANPLALFFSTLMPWYVASKQASKIACNNRFAGVVVLIRACMQE
jgi:hypothetical protein